MVVDPTQRPTSKDMVEAMWDGKIFFPEPAPSGKPTIDAQKRKAWQKEFRDFAEIFEGYRPTATQWLKLPASCQA